ncbi:MFS transporter [Stenotrophomonas panacihumi]|uniref:MFS transporter n=1 Tax=Stenotrophomonas panacihumi TaxID=676599 RepID=A0A0R0ADW0_9GAMM|nr:MFS transporter [Stenotrophomonas panacihumi]KRG43163.1 MFS transporter [Stenotrophomonas panacihumi]PTN53909.1 MFS transporter [Stenotrophomonas panacihumi]
MSGISTPRAEQHATRAAFFMPGFAVSVWAPIVPFAKSRAGLDEAMLGLVLLCLGAGSLLAMPAAGALAARQGCRKVMLASLAVMCATLPLLALAGSPLWLGAVLFVFGAGVGAMDCAMNLQAVAVERAAGRAMMSGFHAFYSIGGFCGAAVMTALLAVAVPPLWAAGGAVVALCGLAVFSVPHWHRERIDHEGPLLAWPHGFVLFLGVLAFVVFLAEGSMLDWSAVFLSEVRGVEPSRAGAGYVVFALSMTLARLLGDGVVQRLGRQRAVLAGGLLASVGFALVTLVPAWWLSLCGYALVGIGCANIVPVLFSLAGNQRAMPETIAVPAMSTLGYAGVLAGPALIGFLAHASSLVFAFLCVAVALLGVAASSRWLRV